VHGRALAMVFGEVEVHRLTGPRASEPAPRGRRAEPPEEKHSHGLRRLAAVEAARGSFDEAAGAVERATGDRLGKRQVEELAARTAVDFDDFYATRKLPPAADPGDVLALSADGKGIVMRPEALRPATARAAAKTSPKLATRLSKGEKRNRKRMAELGAVYDAAPVTGQVIAPLTRHATSCCRAVRHREGRVPRSPLGERTNQFPSTRQVPAAPLVTGV
jgi:hypothetical protein